MGNVSAPAQAGTGSTAPKPAPAFQGAVTNAKTQTPAPKPAPQPAPQQPAAAAKPVYGPPAPPPAPKQAASQPSKPVYGPPAPAPVYGPPAPQQAAKPVYGPPAPTAQQSAKPPAKKPGAPKPAPQKPAATKPVYGPPAPKATPKAASKPAPKQPAAAKPVYGPPAPVWPQKFDAANVGFIDTAKWFKEGLFGVRAFGRLPLEGPLGTGGLIPKANEKLFNLRVESLAERGITVPGVTKTPVVAKPIIIPGASTPVANPQPVITRTTPLAGNGKPLIIPGQVTPPVNPPQIIVGPQSAPSGKPLIVPGQSAPSGKPIVIPGKPPAPQPTSVQPKIAATEARLGKLTTIANGTKVIGLGGFSIAANMQKGAEVYGFWTSGDPGDKGRAVASGAEFLNNARIGATGFSPLMKPGSAVANFTTKYMGGAFGTKLGVGANVVAGGARITGAALDYRTDMAQAKTGHDRNVAQYKVWEKTVGIGLDTGNDIYPYVAGKAEPLAWSTWLGGKLADHGAQTVLKDSGYKPVSIGAEKARNLMPLVSLLGDAGVPGVPKRPDLRDMTKPMTADQKLVAQFDNGINKAAGVGAGVTDLTVTAVELGAVAYATRGKETVPVAYAVLNLDHAARQGLNVWTDRYWQRPQEREASVTAAGLDPKLDTRAVVHQQQDFLHRSWAQAAANFTSGFLDGKEDFGKNSKGEQRWLDLDRKYTSGKISLNTARASSAWYDQMMRPETVANVLIPGMPIVSKVLDPRNLGVASAYTQEYAGRAADAAGRAWDATGKAWNDTTRSISNGVNSKIEDAKKNWNRTSTQLQQSWNTNVAPALNTLNPMNFFSPPAMAAVPKAPLRTPSAGRSSVSTSAQLQQSWKANVQGAQRNWNGAVKTVQTNFDRTVRDTKANVQSQVRSARNTIKTNARKVENGIRSTSATVQQSWNSNVKKAQNSWNSTVRSAQTNFNRTKTTVQRSVTTNIRNTQNAVNSNVRKVQAKVTRTTAKVQQSWNANVQKAQHNWNNSVKTVQVNWNRASAKVQRTAGQVQRSVQSNVRKAQNAVQSNVKKVQNGFNQTGAKIQQGWNQAGQAWNNLWKR